MFTSCNLSWRPRLPPLSPSPTCAFSLVPGLLAKPSTIPGNLAPLHCQCYACPGYSAIPRASWVPKGLHPQAAVPGGHCPRGGTVRLSLTQAAEAAARAAEEAARQRGRLAGEYAASLRHQLKHLRQDLRARQEQWASFCSALTEARRLLQAGMVSGPETSSQVERIPEG